MVPRFFGPAIPVLLLDLGCLDAAQGIHRGRDGGHKPAAEAKKEHHRWSPLFSLCVWHFWLMYLMF